MEVTGAGLASRSEGTQSPICPQKDIGTPATGPLTMLQPSCLATKRKPTQQPDTTGGPSAWIQPDPRVWTTASMEEEEGEGRCRTQLSLTPGLTPHNTKSCLLPDLLCLWDSAEG